MKEIKQLIRNLIGFKKITLGKRKQLKNKNFYNPQDPQSTITTTQKFNWTLLMIN